MVSALRYVLLIVGGFAAGLVLAAPGVDTYIDFGRESVLASDMAAVAAGAVVALLVATVCRGRGQVTTAALIGAALVGIVALPGAWRDDVYFATIGAGLLLGALTVMCLGSHPVQRQSVLAGGAVAGLVTATPIAEYRQFVAVSPGGYARYVEASVQPVNTVWLMLSVVVLVLTVATVTVGGIGADPPRGWDVRELVVGVGLPVVAVALYWSFDRALYAPTSEIGGGRWVLGVVMVPIVIAAALWLRGQTGRVLLAAAALYVSFRDAENWIPGAWVMLLIPLALVAVGAWLARRHPMPLVGIGVLAVCRDGDPRASAVGQRACRGDDVRGSARRGVHGRRVPAVDRAGDGDVTGTAGGAVAAVDGGIRVDGVHAAHRAGGEPEHVDGDVGERVRGVGTRVRCRDGVVASAPTGGGAERVTPVRVVEVSVPCPHAVDWYSR